MGDMTKFNSAIEYYIFNVLLMCLLISEIFIFFYTRSKQNRTEKIDTRDLGEYSCAVTPQVRQTGNRLSGLAGTAYASLFT